MKNHRSSNSKLIKSILDNDLTGHTIRVLQHTDPNLVGIKGKVKLETKFTIHIETDGGLKITSKTNGIFIIQTDKLDIQVNGQLIAGTSRSRKKKKYRDW